MEGKDNSQSASADDLPVTATLANKGKKPGLLPGQPPPPPGPPPPQSIGKKFDEEIAMIADRLETDLQARTDLQVTKDGIAGYASLCEDSKKVCDAFEVIMRKRTKYELAAAMKVFSVKYNCHCPSLFLGSSSGLPRFVKRLAVTEFYYGELENVTSVLLAKAREHFSTRDIEVSVTKDPQGLFASWRSTTDIKVYITYVREARLAREAHLHNTSGD
jgi:hypothetical protein